MTPGEAALVGGAGLAAGAVNAMAGGGSLISFPALLAVGYPPVTANVTNTVALLPGYLSSVVGGRRELAGQRDRMLRLSVLGVVGAAGGAVLLLTTPGEVFQAVVPYLILLGCALLAVQPLLSRRVRRAAAGGPAPLPVPLGLVVPALLASVYGACFGAGLGVMLLGVLGVFLHEVLARVNALKNLLSFVINSVAVVALALFGPVAWTAAAFVAVGSLLGGYLGALLARRVPATLLRVLVVVYGVVVAGVLLVRGT